MKVLEDFLNIYTKYDGKTLSKSEKQNRQKEFYIWYENNYSEFPSLTQVLDFITKHNINFNDLFFEKVIMSCINKVVEEENVEDLKAIFHANSSATFQNRQVFSEFFKYSNFKYSPLQLANMVLTRFPQDKIILDYKLQLLSRYISISVHEVPIGVLPSLYNIDEFNLEDSLKVLDEYKEIYKSLNYEPTEFETKFIVLCEKIYRCYDDYLNNIKKYNNFEDYLSRNKVNYNALFAD
jgi:hypothetical protein